MTSADDKLDIGSYLPVSTAAKLDPPTWIVLFCQMFYEKGQQNSSIVPGIGIQVRNCLVLSSHPLIQLNLRSHVSINLLGRQKKEDD